MKHFTNFKSIVFLFAAMLGSIMATAQCDAGEIEVEIQISTDDWGYEVYWELLPAGSACGSETIASGGNTDVGCDGGGDQNQAPGGYDDNATIMEGPWCLTIGTTYKLVYVDDWGDGGANFDVIIGGLGTYAYEGSGNGNSWNFTIIEPPALDASAIEIHSYSYVTQSAQVAEVEIKNLGVNTITELELQYTINGAQNVTETFSGLNVPSNEAIHVEFLDNMNMSFGLNDVEITVISVNGGTDEVPDNDSVSKDIELGNPIPNVIDGYLGTDPSINVISAPSSGLDSPRDLDFHPVLSRFELWVINKGTENSGGSTVRFDNAGMADQDDEWKQDGNAWHFMSLPTAIAFGENENFGTSPGVYDANHDGGQPFTGPSLWSSDPDIYAEDSGGNGSHLDMLHVSPYAQGMAHEVDNVFWVVDGHNKDVVRYDFADDHGPGNSYHGDAIIHRYAEFEIEKDPGNHIVSHCVLDKETGWLYVVDHGNARVLRIDITTGTLGSTPSFGPFEDIVDYKYVTGYVWEEIITQDLIEPAGIDIVGNRLLVSDHANGDIVVYDVDNSFVELGRIETIDSGIMGIKVGPWGRVWFVNATTEEVGIVEGNALSVDQYKNNLKLEVYPNPSTGELYLNCNAPVGGLTYSIVNTQGAVVLTGRISDFGRTFIATEALAAGIYAITASIGDNQLSTVQFVKQ
jgi:hypothetical protein